MKKLIAISLVLGLAFACGDLPDYWVISKDRPEGLVTPEWEQQALAIADVVRETEKPSRPFGGVIYITDKPFACVGYLDMLCAGQSFGGSVKVVWNSDPWKTALAHELCHEVHCSPGGDCSEKKANECVARAKAFAFTQP